MMYSNLCLTCHETLPLIVKIVCLIDICIVRSVRVFAGRYRAVFKRDSLTRLDWPESGKYHWIGVSTAQDGHFTYFKCFFISFYKYF